MITFPNKKVILREIKREEFLNEALIISITFRCTSLYSNVLKYMQFSLNLNHKEKRSIIHPMNFHTKYSLPTSKCIRAES